MKKLKPVLSLITALLIMLGCCVDVEASITDTPKRDYCEIVEHADFDDTWVIHVGDERKGRERIPCYGTDKEGKLLTFGSAYEAEVYLEGFGWECLGAERRRDGSKEQFVVWMGKTKQ